MLCRLMKLYNCRTNTALHGTRSSGTGFSIACRPNTFSYGALLGEADFSGFSGDAASIFKLIGTADFEKVVESLKIAAKLMRLYGSDSLE